MSPRRLPRPRPSERRVDCRYASQCVDLAAKQGWPGFSCRGCGAFEPLSAFERRRDMEAMEGLLRAIAGAPMRLATARGRQRYSG